MPYQTKRNTLALLEQLYLGAIDEDELKPFLSNLAQAYNASLASFANMDGLSRQDYQRVTRWADQRDYVGNVPGYYAARSPFRPIMLLEGNYGRVMATNEMVSTERHARDIFINEFLRPAGHEYLVTGIFARARDQHNYFVLNRGHRQGDFSPEDAAELQELVPHLRTMLRLRNSMVSRERHIDFSQSLAERSGDGLVVLDRHGKVHSMNGRATEILAEADGLSLENGRLKAASSEDDQHLVCAVLLLLHNCAEHHMPPAASLTLRRPSGARPYRLHVMPLTPRKFLFAGDDVELVVQIVAATFDRNGMELAEQFGVSPAELRVARHLVAGMPLKQVAEACGNSVNTIKVHRRNLYRKLGINRHYDLVRLFGGGVQG